jgi:hypothetical protein
MTFELLNDVFQLLIPHCTVAVDSRHRFLGLLLLRMIFRRIAYTVRKC